MEYLYFSGIKEKTADTLNNMNEPWNSYSDFFQKPDKNEYMLYDSVGLNL